MSKKIFNVLITGPSMIQEKHLEQLKANNINPIRIDNPTKIATEKELTDAVKGMDGYILGFIEKVTENVINSGKDLKAICFTGTGWRTFIPAHEYATQKGIAITAALGANAQATAELTVSLIHDRVRYVSYLTGKGTHELIRGRNFRGLTVGIVGVGDIGSKVAKILHRAYGCKILYASRSRKIDFEFNTGAQEVSLEELLAKSDIVSLHTDQNKSSIHLLNAKNLPLLKKGAVLVNCSFKEAIDMDALYNILLEAQEKDKENVRPDLTVGLDAYLPDSNTDDRFTSFSPKYLIDMGKHTGYNTEDSVRIGSDIATEAMIGLLTQGESKYVVNPEYKKGE